MVLVSVMINHASHSLRPDASDSDTHASVVGRL